MSIRQFSKHCLIEHSAISILGRWIKMFLFKDFNEYFYINYSQNANGEVF